MGLFSKKDESTKQENAVSEKKSSKKKNKAISGVAGRVTASWVLRGPLITEKAHFLSEQSQYAFKVAVRASKKQIRKSVEEAYGVHVTNVRTIRIRPKKKVRGKVVGYRSMIKKAIVRLQKGETIELFEGMGI